MIDVTYTVGEELILLTMRGHAGSAEWGHDLVCASVSILSYTLAAAMDKKHMEGELTRKPEVSLLPGDASIMCSPLPAERRDAIGAYELVLTGFELLSGKYPDHVRLTRNGVSPEP